MGLIFGWLRLRTRSLIPGMILHAAWNAANILLELRG
jgi:membrane protease YdiL (CAAX protease family)